MTDLGSVEVDGPCLDARVPGSYWVWLCGAAMSMLGTHVMAFAMAWTATAYGGLFAGLVLTMTVLPRTVMALVGGAVADQVGPWRVMIAGDAVMIAAMLVVAASVARVGEAPALLLATSLTVGLVDAFYFPSSASVPRILVHGRGLARASSARQIVHQLAGLVGAPLGGVVVSVAGLSAAAMANAVTFGVMLLVLLMLKSRVTEPEADGDDPAPLWRRAVDGVRISAVDPLLRPVLLLTVAAAALLLPQSSLLMPLLARERNWSADSAGVIVGAIAIGTVAVAVTVMVRGAHPRAGLVAILGLVVSGLGIALVAVAPVPAAAAAAGSVAGFGTGLFTTHIVPMILGRAPRSHVARVQAVVLMAQSFPLLVTNNGLGAVADVTRTAPVMFLCAVSLIGCALAALASRSLRQHTTARPLVRPSPGRDRFRRRR
ncbi:MFS transporter [Phytoactinopolyspora endophytica]|uniref:MFS transporter n=1 Tax=Phytoactinopolyspora endophytica TaxID=1642495 RepID=UPI00101C1777|nr:MFS transporter [Phytoactinopolyspora endophytica]